MKLSKNKGLATARLQILPYEPAVPPEEPPNRAQTYPEHEIQETPILVECVQRLWDAVCAGAHREGKHEPQEDREV